MKLSPLALAATLAAPAATSAWMMDRSPFWNYGLIRPVDILREQQALANRVARQFDDCLSQPSRSLVMRPTAPRYQIRSDEDTFAVALDAPGMTPDDLKISYENDSGLLSITGRRQFESERGRYAERFARSFYLDPSVDVDQLSANLENGVLVVSAPRDANRVQNRVRSITIAAPTAAPEPALEEEHQPDPQGGATSPLSASATTELSAKHEAAASTAQITQEVHVSIADAGKEKLESIKAKKKAAAVDDFDDEEEVLDLDSNEDF